MSGKVQDVQKVADTELNDRFFRWTGAAAIIAGGIYLAIQLLHPSDTLGSVTMPMWVIVHVLSMVMDLAAIIALTGIYAVHAHKFKIFGFIGYMLFSLFFGLSLAFHFLEAFVFPVLATSAPEFINGVQGLVTGAASEVNLGVIPILYAIAGLSYLLGGFLLGLSIFRAKILPCSAGLLLTIGALVTLLGAIIPHPLDRVMAIPVGLALVWVGWSMVAIGRSKNNIKSK